MHSCNSKALSKSHSHTIVLSTIKERKALTSSSKALSKPHSHTELLSTMIMAWCAGKFVKGRYGVFCLFLSPTSSRCRPRCKKKTKQNEWAEYVLEHGCTCRLENTRIHLREQPTLYMVCHLVPCRHLR